MEKYDTERRKAQCKEKNLDPKTWYGKTVKNGQFHFATVERTTTWRSARRKLAIKLGVPEVNSVTQSFQVEKYLCGLQNGVFNIITFGFLVYHLLDQISICCAFTCSFNVRDEKGLT